MAIHGVPIEGSGKLYIEDERGRILLAENVTLTIMDPEIHKTVKSVCRFHTRSYDSHQGVIEDACHHPANIPTGTSWGECCPMKCPLR